MEAQEGWLTPHPAGSFDHACLEETLVGISKSMSFGKLYLGQAGWGFELPGLVGCVPAMAGGVELGDL